MPSTRKKTTKKRATAATPSPQAQKHIEDVILLMAKGLRDAQLRQVAIEVAKIDPGKVDAVITEARQQLTRAADFNRDQELAESITQWRELYRLGVTQNDITAASGARNRLDNLLALKRPPVIDPPDPAGKSPEAEAIRAHLVPLGLTEDEENLVEIVRLAALAVMETR